MNACCFNVYFFSAECDDTMDNNSSEEDFRAMTLLFDGPTEKLRATSSDGTPSEVYTTQSHSAVSAEESSSCTNCFDLQSDIHKKDTPIEPLSGGPGLKIACRPIKMKSMKSNSHKNRRLWRLSPIKQSTHLNGRKIKRLVRRKTDSSERKLDKMPKRGAVKPSERLRAGIKTSEEIVGTGVNNKILSDKEKRNRTRVKRYSAMGVGIKYSLSDNFWEIPVTQIMGKGIEDVKIRFARPLIKDPNEETRYRTSSTEDTSYRESQQTPDRCNIDIINPSTTKIYESSPKNVKDMILISSDDVSDELWMRQHKMPSRGNSGNQRFNNYLNDFVRDRSVFQQQNRKVTTGSENLVTVNNNWKKSLLKVLNLVKTPYKAVAITTSYATETMFIQDRLESKNVSEVRSQQKFVSSNEFHSNSSTKSVKLNRDENIQVVLSDPEDSKEIKQLKWNAMFQQSAINVPQVANEKVQKTESTFRVSDSQNAALMKNYRKYDTSGLLSRKNDVFQPKLNLPRPLPNAANKTEESILYKPPDNRAEGHWSGTSDPISPSQIRIFNPIGLESEKSNQNIRTGIGKYGITKWNPADRISSVLQNRSLESAKEVGANRPALNYHTATSLRDGLTRKNGSSNMMGPTLTSINLGRPLLENVNATLKTSKSLKLPEDLLGINGGTIPRVVLPDAYERIIGESLLRKPFRGDSLSVPKPSELPVKTSDYRGLSELTYPRTVQWGRNTTDTYLFDRNKSRLKTMLRSYTTNQRLSKSLIKDFITGVVSAEIESGVERKPTRVPNKRNPTGEGTDQEYYSLTAPLLENSRPGMEFSRIADPVTSEESEGTLKELNGPTRNRKIFSGADNEGGAAHEGRSDIYNVPTLHQQSPDKSESLDYPVRQLYVNCESPVNKEIADINLKNASRCSYLLSTVPMHRPNPPLIMQKETSKRIGAEERADRVSRILPVENAIETKDFDDEQLRSKKSQLQSRRYERVYPRTDDPLNDTGIDLLKLKSRPQISRTYSENSPKIASKTTGARSLGGEDSDEEAVDYIESPRRSNSETVRGRNSIIDDASIARAEELDLLKSTPFDERFEGTTGLPLTEGFSNSVLREVTAYIIDNSRNGLKDPSRIRNKNISIGTYDDSDTIASGNKNETDVRSKNKYASRSLKLMNGPFLNSKDDKILLDLAEIVGRAKSKHRDDNNILTVTLGRAKNKIKTKNISSRAVAESRKVRKNYVPPIDITIAMKNLFNRIDPKDVSVTNSNSLSSDGSYKIKIKLKDNPGKLVN